jgi:anti-sigma regulatory factor (Ser/Thr protein kinase)
VEQNEWVPADPDTVVLAMTEMVTNSIRHASGPVEVELTSDSRVLAVRVSDSSELLPHQCTVPFEAEGGRGLILLELLATRWGVRIDPHGGKTVWCEFTVPVTS